jgi:hypothetical protein
VYEVAVDQCRRFHVGIERYIVRLLEAARHHINLDERRFEAEMFHKRQHAPRRLCLDPVDLHGFFGKVCERSATERVVMIISSR